MTSSRNDAIVDRVLNVALTGAGEVAMTIHLPTLLLCSHLFRLLAITDITAQALEHCSTKFHVPKTFTDVGEMLREMPEAEVVFVINASEYHAIHAIQCLRAGKHVFIEKPVALCHADAESIAQAQEETGKIVFVGYMRRYATAFLRVRDMVKEMPRGEMNYVRVRDIIGSNSFFIDQSGSFPRRFMDFPAGSAGEKIKITTSIMSRALGPKAQDPRDVSTWNSLAGLASHDLSAMREIIGMPKRVLSATRSPNGLFLTVVFQDDGFACYYETGIDSVRNFDAHIEVLAEKQHVKVTYDTPFIKGLPITATILSSKPNGDHSEEVIRPTFEDAYTLEYKDLYDAIVRGKEVKTSARDASEDLKLFDMIMGALGDV